MKQLIFGISFLTLNSLILAQENDYLLPLQSPSFEEIRFAYQRNVLERSFPWNIKEKCLLKTNEGESLIERFLELMDIYPIHEQTNYMTPISSLATTFFLKTFSCKDDKTHLAKKYILNYVAYHQISKYQALPEYLIPVNEEIINDFTHKSYRSFFSEKIAPIYINFSQCTQGLISPRDEQSIQRVCNDKSSDKAILFVGFSQNCPTEGSEITYDTPGYRKSLFWSLWEKQPDKKHNSIKFCFSQSENFLYHHLEYEEFFDYIIIGGQTIEYIPTETWISLGKMLKKNGRMVYPNLGYFGWGTFINKLLNSSLPQNFNIYMCDNPQDPILKEILQLASFNNQPTYGAFCYKKAKQLYWHKKTK